MGADLQTILLLRVLITEDFPTFGYPINPTLIVFLSLWKLSYYLRRLIKLPFPNEFVVLEWKARVGYSLERYLTHFAVTQVGTRSHLFRISTRCLWGQFFLICSSINLLLVPFGSLASITWITTSEESNTLYNSSQILLDYPASILLSLFSSFSSRYKCFLKLESLLVL